MSEIPGIIFAIDVAALRMGVAAGPPGTVPISYTVRLKRADDLPEVALGNLIAFLAQRFAELPPTLIAKEAPLPLGARVSNPVTVRLTLGLHGIIEGMARRFAVPWVEAYDQTIRKHFLGRANMGDRAATKAAVIARCHLLKYLPHDCVDNDRADALAVWDWACAHHARRPPKVLHMFGEQPA